MLLARKAERRAAAIARRFQWAPTLGGECYGHGDILLARCWVTGFNGHPPLGVNATALPRCNRYARAPGFNGHPPLGVNATDEWLIDEW